MNPIHNPTPHFYEFHFNIIVHVTYVSAEFEVSEVKIYV
jgi:hypothetical protein